MPRSTSSPAHPPTPATWVYADEPTSAFSTHVAKYFTNSIREDGLLALARAGVVYAPGGAGTAQEIFTDAAQNTNTLYEVRSPMVFFERAFYEEAEPELLAAVRRRAAAFGWAGLVTVAHTERDHQFPERTIYELTDAGREQAREWLTDMLAVPRNEFPQFPAALSFAMLLGPEQLLTVLERRRALLRESLAALDEQLGGTYDHLPRVTLIETEYQRAVAAAELGWVDGVVADLRSGELHWSGEELARIAQASRHD